MMNICRNLGLSCLLIIILCLPVSAQQVGGLKSGIIVSNSGSEDCFPIVSKVLTPAILRYDTNDYKGVIRAIGDLQSDIYKVTGIKPKIVGSDTSSNYEIVIGTLGKSKLIDKLTSSGKLAEKDIKGKWESFVITTIENPKPGVKQYLVVAGSDERGTIYGIYEISRQLGVSPWYWWADVPPKKRSAAYVLPGYYASGEPKVKYRGIFINDEEPSFGTWARKKFGGINSKMYAHIFELLLRLRANYLWPAMWGKSFNMDDPENPRLANEYGIIMGTPHNEPMMRSRKGWNVHHKEYGNGQWNYLTNAVGLERFWKEGLERTKNYENVVTVGMRGNGDKPMISAGSDQKNIKLLEKIISDQRKIIEKVTKRPAYETPQVLTLYSEVQKYYDEGMKLPHDIIIMLCDDNWGDIRRLPELGKKKHPGGYGIYYHIDLHGAPRSYQWLNMTQIPHMWEQLQLAYSYGVNKIWMLNVGDLKPMEYPITFFMDMAWNPDSFVAGNLHEFTRKFCQEQFGAKAASEAAYILSTYCKYNSRITAEMLNQHTYNLESGEFRQVRDAYLALEAMALRQFLEMPDTYKDAYNELILFPVQAMANLYDLYYSVAMNEKYASEKDLNANYWADHAWYCFKRDSALMYEYNHKIAGGKWNHMMDQVHIGYTSWDAPKRNIMPKVTYVKQVDVEQGGYIFNEKDGVVVMEAEHYFNSKATEKTRWTVIPCLGRTLSGLALMPYTEKTNGSMLTYKMKMNTKSDSVKVRMIFHTTLPFNKTGLRVAVSLDGGKQKVRNIDSLLNWKHNYSKMYPAAAARIIETDITFPLIRTLDKTHILKIRPLNPGVVFEKVIVDDGGYEQTFLKMPESPYKKE